MKVKTNIKFTSEELENIESFLNGFLECSLWASLDDDDDVAFDYNYSISDFSDKALEKLKADCIEFLTMNNNYNKIKFNYDEFSTAGHDFFLSRNGHGAGFFDRNLTIKGMPKSVCNDLQKDANTFKELNLYAKDGKIYLDI